MAGDRVKGGEETLGMPRQLDRRVIRSGWRVGWCEFWVREALRVSFEFAGSTTRIIPDAEGAYYTKAQSSQ